MEELHLRHIHNVLTRRGRKPSGLHDHIQLIKLAYEGNLGVPTICKILEDAGVTDGTSIPNVQGFIRRQQKLGTIGKKGCNKVAFDLGLKEVAKPTLEQASSQKTKGDSSATTPHSSLSKSLRSLSASSDQASPSDPSDPVAKLKTALKKKKP